MTSPITDKHIQLPTGINNLYNNTDSFMSSFSCTVPSNISYAHCTSNNNNNNNNGINNTNNNNISSSNGSDSSNLITLSMLNQALNLNVERQQLPPLQFQEIQKMSDNKMSGRSISPNLIAEYQRIKQTIDKSGLLSPNENLVTQNRGECYWSNCYFQSDIEESFKKHLTDCHHLTSSALVQLDISLEKSLHLSNMLIKEQNHLYNMMLHLDQKLKSLPGESSTLSDFHYLNILLNKFKQIPTLFDCPPDNVRMSSDISPQLPLYSNNHMANLHQHSPTINKPMSTFPQQLIDNLSSALLRQQSLPASVQNGTYQQQQQIFSTSHATQPTQSFGSNIGSLPMGIKSEVINSNPLFTPGSMIPSPSCGNPNPNHQLTTIDSNLKDILSQSRSSDSNYAHSESALSTHIKDKKSKSIRRTTSGDQGQQLSKNMSDRDYYRTYAVRPSASYVNLIKTAIMESDRRELSLNEIYVWMQTEFSYFRDKEQKWKNAIRHNLSLHKCFQRKHGKLWTFNEKEYNLKKSRNRFQYNVPISGSEAPNAEGDCYDDDDDEDPNDNENTDNVIKKESNYNDENIPDEMVLDTDEWSKYLHKNSLKTNSSSIDISTLPNVRTDRCTTLDN